MENLKKVLTELNKQYPIDINGALFKFEAYMNNILEKNKEINLTAIKEKNEFITKHFIDSLTAAKLPYFKNAHKIVDIGTGAGFPGVPLAIIFPKTDFLLVDSLKKKLLVIEKICESLSISNVKTCHARAEDLGRDKAHREKYDICVSRAVASFEVLSEYCIPLVKNNGIFIAYKGPKAEEEIERSLYAIKILGGKYIGEYKPDFENFISYEHKLYIIQKDHKTPEKYPRKAGVPGKVPLNKLTKNGNI